MVDVGLRASLIGSGEASGKMISFARKAAKSDFTILLLGESGVGKDHLAHLIHDEGRGKEKKRFVPFDCGCVDPELFASELFGHEKGSFTGAVSNKEGLVSVANEGTLFFNEIANIPINIQPRFLRVLEKRSYRRVGGTDELPVDARIIAATNANLAEMVKSGTMRSDVYHRLNVITYRIPPLRERKEDIVAIAEYFLRELHVTKTFDSRVARALTEYCWPGNIRELRSAIAHAVFDSEEDDVIELRHLPPELNDPITLATTSNTILLHSEHMKQYYKDLIAAAKGNKTLAARLSGLSFETVKFNLGKYKLVEYAALVAVEASSDKR